MRFAHQCAWFAVLIFAAACATAGTLDGRIQTSQAKLDLASFIVYVDDLDGHFPPAERVVVMDQQGLRFVPHVLAVQSGTTVEFANNDPLAHNVFSISTPKRFNLGLYGRGTSRRVKFDEPGVVQLLCNVHQEMSAFIVVVKSPYFARTDKDGSFRIENVPPGRHQLRVWHEGIGERSYEIRLATTGLTRKTINVD